MDEIQSTRLNLKLYCRDDFQNFIDLMTDETVMRHVGDGVLTQVKAEKLWQKVNHELYPSGLKTIWAVFSKSSASFIGHAWIRPRPAKPDDWEIGYIIKRKYWGNGLATEIAQTLVRYGFLNLDLSVVFATIDDDNVGSIKVAQKAGLRFEAYEYDEIGRFSVYSIPREDYCG